MKPAHRQSATPLRQSKPIVLDRGPWKYVWRVKDELAFLRGLGHWRDIECVADRADLLRGYLQGLALRRRWTGLQREPLECEARLLLQELENARGLVLRRSA